MTQRTVYLSFLVTCGAILISSVLQFCAARHVDAAELYALEAARDYEFAVLIQKTKELNQAALAVLRHALDTPCAPEKYFSFGRQTDRSEFRRSAPLPATPIYRSQPERAMHQSD